LLSATNFTKTFSTFSNKKLDSFPFAFVWQERSNFFEESASKLKMVAHIDYQIFTLCHFIVHFSLDLAPLFVLDQTGSSQQAFCTVFAGVPLLLTFLRP
jgi:hypothetical protein